MLTISPLMLFWLAFTVNFIFTVNMIGVWSEYEKQHHYSKLFAILKFVNFYVNYEKLVHNWYHHDT